MHSLVSFQHQGVSIISFLCFKVISITAMPANDFSVLENVKQ